VAERGKLLVDLWPTPGATAMPAFYMVWARLQMFCGEFQLELAIEPNNRIMLM